RQQVAIGRLPAAHGARLGEEAADRIDVQYQLAAGQQMIVEALEYRQGGSDLGDQLERAGRHDDGREALVVGEGVERLARERRSQATLEALLPAVLEHLLRGVETLDGVARLEQGDEYPAIADGRLENGAIEPVQALPVVFQVAE